jgi:hypothetical protein
VQSAEKQRIVGEWEHECKKLEKWEKSDVYKGREQRNKIERQEQGTGIGRPMFVISDRLAPLPPRSPFMKTREIEGSTVYNSEVRSQGRRKAYTKLTF